VTATLHALGCGPSAGVYYTEDPNREAHPRSRDNYYTRDGNGTWWSSGSSLVRCGAPIDKETFRDLCGGFNPRTGKRLVRGAGERHRAGWDITFSTPKSFGILWAAGTAEQRSVLEGIQQDAVDQALQFAADEGLVQVRLGAGGHLQEVPADMVAPSGPGRAVGCAEKRIEFRFDQESDDPPVETLAWNGKHAFDYGGMLGMSKRCVPEQRTDGGKSSIAGARTIVPLLLKMVEEGTDERRIKIVDVQLRWLDVFPIGGLHRSEANRPQYRKQFFMTPLLRRQGIV